MSDGSGEGSRLSLRHQKDLDSGVYIAWSFPQGKGNRMHSQHLLVAPHTAVLGGS